MLVHFVEDHFLTQQIREGTRKEAILDLLFTSNENLVLKCTQINHVNLTDHKTCVAQLSYHMNPQGKQENKNFKTTKIPDYDTAGTDEEDWLRAGKLFGMVKWKEVLADKSETDATNIILHEMEDVGIKTMHHKANTNRHINNEDDTESAE